MVVLYDKNILYFCLIQVIFELLFKIELIDIIILAIIKVFKLFFRYSINICKLKSQLSCFFIVKLRDN